MTPELKAKWLEALRSGRYEQGRSTMRAGNKFCCLGVLCDVAGYEWRSVDSLPTLFCCDAGTDFITTVTERNKLGLPEEIHRACYRMNDGVLGENNPYTFAEIADFLEEHLK